MSLLHQVRIPSWVTTGQVLHECTVKLKPRERIGLEWIFTMAASMPASVMVSCPHAGLWIHYSLKSLLSLPGWNRRQHHHSMSLTIFRPLVALPTTEARRYVLVLFVCHWQHVPSFRSCKYVPRNARMFTPSYFIVQVDRSLDADSCSLFPVTFWEVWWYSVKWWSHIWNVVWEQPEYQLSSDPA